MPDYTDPKLRERLKARIQKSDKGGRSGQWSARKAQLLAQAYKKEGGGYRGEKGDKGKSLERWGKERWTTADGGQARRKGGTTRYLPKKAWESLTAEEKKATQKAKRAGSQDGNQFVANTPAAKRARAKITKAKGGGKKKSKRASAARAAGKKTAKKTANKKRSGKKVARKKTGSKKKSSRTVGRKKTAGKKKAASKKKTAGKKKAASKKKTAGKKKTGKKTTRKKISKKT